MSAHDFDFWLGEWEVRWDGGTQIGMNVIERILDGHVLLERFDGRPGIDLQGMSVSVYDETACVWRQTWVDNQGSYLEFAGALADGVMDLRGRQNSEPVRMQWRDIRSCALTWLWQRSLDGETWTTLWELHYRRSR